jgi:hypothetical protein
MPVDLVFMRDLRAALANCPSADTVRAHYQEGLPLMNALPNLSFFMSVQTGRPITIVRAEQASGAEATADPLVCEFHFSQPESEAKQAR